MLSPDARTRAAEQARADLQAGANLEEVVSRIGEGMAAVMVLREVLPLNLDLATALVRGVPPEERRRLGWADLQALVAVQPVPEPLRTMWVFAVLNQAAWLRLERLPEGGATVGYERDPEGPPGGRTAHTLAAVRAALDTVMSDPDLPTVEVVESTEDLLLVRFPVA